MRAATSWRMGSHSGSRLVGCHVERAGSFPSGRILTCKIRQGIVLTCKIRQGVIPVTRASQVWFINNRVAEVTPRTPCRLEWSTYTSYLNTILSSSTSAPAWKRA